MTRGTNGVGVTATNGANGVLGNVLGNVLERDSRLGEARGAKTLAVADAGGRRRPPLGACLLVYLPSRRGAAVWG